MDDEVKPKPLFKLGLLQKVRLTMTVMFIFGKAVVEKCTKNHRTMTSVVQGNLQWIYLKHFLTWGFSMKLLGLITPSTRTTYSQWCAKRKAQPNAIELLYGAVALWYGKQRPEKSSDKVLLFLHGGGFALGGSEDHWTYIQSLMDKAGEKNVQLSTVFLEYELTTRYSYPRQLIQAASILQYLIYTEGWRPSQIILSGNSAGGNLIFALFLHILTPCPDVPIKITLPDNEPINAAIALSPWVGRIYPTGKPTADTPRGPNELRNDKIDIINQRSLEGFSIEWLGDIGENVDTRWAQLDTAPMEWWLGLGGVCGNILVTAQTEEALYDSIIDFVEKVKKGGDPEVYDDITDYGEKVKRGEGPVPKLWLELMAVPGVHCEPALSCGTEIEKVGLWTMVLDWFGNVLV